MELLHFSRTVSAQYSEFAAIALSFYEWMICFDLEVEHIWKSKLSGVSLLYYLNRYGGMLCGIFVILHIQPCCKVIIGFEMATNIIQLLAVAVFAALRVYAVCNRNNWMLAFVLVLVLIHPAITTYTYAELALGWRLPR
ncbi:hypothetical protein A0H81_12160 [Grifola frondosa]|uniref:DUF6533 domain-containing protein n=1 Tax=Grifola frondosa TaxID=5627 RepID=A0A1C7LUQ0_GRIFR|nr:hypothetical protein A0H81_12160 [Grifola frondosa]